MRLEEERFQAATRVEGGTTSIAFGPPRSGFVLAQDHAAASTKVALGPGRGGGFHGRKASVSKRSWHQHVLDRARTARPTPFDAPNGVEIVADPYARAPLKAEEADRLQRGVDSTVVSLTVAKGH